MPSKLPWAKLVALLGGPAAATTTIVGAREGTGTVPELEGLDKPELAQADRFAQGALARQTTGKGVAYLGLPAAVAYEGAKAVEQSPFANFATRTLLDLAGGPINEKTSPASWANISAYAQGISADPQALQPPPDIRLAGTGSQQRR